MTVPCHLRPLALRRSRPGVRRACNRAGSGRAAARRTGRSKSTEIEDADEGGLVGTVSVEGQFDEARIAIPAFATDRNVPTAASSDGTAALGVQLARVITTDLTNNGLFRPTGPDALPKPSYAQITAPAWATWSGRNSEMLVQGYVRGRSDGRLIVGCYLYDVALQSELVREGWVVPPSDWRRAAHKCADLVYSRLTGESPFFDSRIAYIAETGPKDNRTKRLAIMDSDGANHRFITTGRSTALTPRYSPDYQQLALSQLCRRQSAHLHLRYRHRAADAGDRKPQPDLRPALEPGWPLHPVFDGGGRQYRHLPRFGARRGTASG